jgi:hypothetical protein
METNRCMINLIQDAGSIQLFGGWNLSSGYSMSPLMLEALLSSGDQIGRYRTLHASLRESLGGGSDRFEVVV